AFQGACDGAGIDDVFGDVSALVDAGQNQVRHGFAEDVARAHDDAIGRRAPHREMTRPDFAQPQGIVQRQRMRDAGLIEFRRHHPDIVGQGARGLRDDLQAGGVDAVVIGAENSHPVAWPFARFHWCRRARLYPSRPVEANPANPGKIPAAGNFLARRRRDRLNGNRRTYCETAAVPTIFDFHYGLAKGLIMTRLSAAATISICWIVFIPNLAIAQSDQATVPSCHAGELLKDGVCVPDEGKCFPGQECREGNCVTKSTPEPAPSTPAAIPARCAGGTIDAAGQCTCPANTHLDADSCLADLKPVRKASDTVVCDGGILTAGKCGCPAGYNLMPANGNLAASGTCVKTDAANCQGGELTVAGSCFCNGRVTMSGENYALELVGGKCVPKRCPEHSFLKDGKCVASGDSNFGFTCRTGYIPDQANPGTAAAGLHCLPDPTFCDARVKRRNGSCPKLSAVAIDCFEAKCVCGDPHAEWLNYLCQCSEPY